MGAYNKFWVALLMAAASYIQAAFDVDIGLDADTATGLINVIGAVLVWAVPNK